MRRCAITILAMTLLACGGSDTADEESMGGAATPQAEQANQVPQPPIPQRDPNVPPPQPVTGALVEKTCLNMIKAGKPEAALRSCTQAVAGNPDDPELQAALAQAQAAAGQKAGNLGDTASAAAAGSGMDLTGMTPEEIEAAKDEMEDRMEAATDELEDAMDEAAEAMDDDEMEDMMEDAADEMEDMMEDATDDMEDRMEEAKDAAEAAQDDADAQLP